MIYHERSILCYPFSREENSLIEIFIKLVCSNNLSIDLSPVKKYCKCSKISNIYCLPKSPSRTNSADPDQTASEEAV